VTVAIALLGGLAGLGGWLVVAGLTRRPRPLAELAAELERDRSDAAVVDAASRWQRIAVGVAWRGTARLRAELEVTERTGVQHAIDRCSTALLLTALPIVIGIAAAMTGVHVPTAVVAVAALAGAPLGWWACDASLARTAAKARRDFRHALATYLDLVVTLIVGGAGVETALADASTVGAGPAFRQLRATLATAQERREPPWRALGRLGHRLGVGGLTELAAAVTLAGENGASVSDSLSVKADALRARELDDERAAAERASEAMSLPVVAMGLGFVVLIMFPALVRLTQI
jgi:Flp pilus assembly protein TadB